ncbi:unnamed protein product, partial [Mesorhabditis belari]|uniref:14-3-3 domain-containing protein n=1 Tax=Mesorhabditis belari TaxID=2138241 RepID=A0AAF3FJ65_9BILA
MSRDDLVQKAKLAEQAERHTDMAKAIKKVTEFGDQLTGEERNLFSMAYKNMIGSRRHAWRVVSTIEQMNKNSSEPANPEVIKNYRLLIEKEIMAVSEEVIELLNKFILPKTTEPEHKVFYLKMKADYHRYIAEVATEDELSSATENAKKAYEEALKVAEQHMRAVNPIRLGLVLNFSVFYYEILKEFDLACELAKESFDTAILQLDTQGDECYKDSTLILQLLRDNLALWTAKATIDANPQNQGTA